MRVFLVGYMGSGKTHIGKKLAARLSVDFADLDDEIERSAGATVAQIFSEKGESGFRELERAVLQDQFRRAGGVVATGGGAPCFFDNMERMNLHGISVYLKASEDLLWARLKNQIAKRPLLAVKTPDEIRQFICDQLKARTPYYEKASVIIDQNQSDEQAVEEIIRRIHGVWTE